MAACNGKNPGEKCDTKVAGVNEGRRRFLVATTSIVGVVGVGGASVPFVRAWLPNAKARAEGAPVRVNIDKLEPGRQIVVEWRGQPVFVTRRSAEMIGALRALEKDLADPESHRSIQPVYVDPKRRSIRPDILVVVGLCTHLGCSPSYRPEVAPVDLGEAWLGGYFCPCHGSRFDLAGRVYKGQPAPTNLSVPPHAYESSHVIVIGVDQREGV
ncbi:ubiquinol-cytochrome c reductase iron-sulfur subunit [Pseudomonas duriflava]|uniref:Ubiquinol-cytochrome c reductase iron-sulfur subunit n=1 Tax=Pseudomonas duriflava TaxID=459528 RepID=A0A562QFC4_9PSED|nr:ubiquinol-cytochrome c reductase iron-sulfur subunit [Pseudomonas duriflava]TWI55419.1 ubiquinol-cytochrome c reductase iron-sulfur subunit [Pseudomonas duriflava]